MARPSLKNKQEAVFSFLLQKQSGGLPPTVREICQATGIKSTSTVHAILQTLEENGFIQREAGASRAIRITGAADAAQVPLLGRVAAGQPILALEDIEGYIPYPMRVSDASQMFALRVEGYSMRDAGILPDDIVVADRSLRCEKNDIVVALIDEEATVKRLSFENGRVVLLPENPDYDPIYPERVVLLGRVIGSFRRY